MLLGARADLNKVDDGHHTALDEACKHGHDRIIKLLAARGAKLGFSGVKVRAPTFRDARYGDANRPSLGTTTACAAQHHRRRCVKTHVHTSQWPSRRPHPGVQPGQLMKCTLGLCRQQPSCAPASSTATCRW